MAFQKGQSGNPGGRPKVAGHIREAAQKHGKKAIEVLVSLLDHEDPRVQISAAQTLLDRGFGKPAQSVELSGDQDNPIQTKWVVEFVDADRKGK